MRVIAVDEVEKIRKEMALIRHDLHYDIAGLVENTGSIFDWRAYLKRWPWLSLGLAGIAGYLIVPGRARPSDENQFTNGHANSLSSHAGSNGKAAKRGFLGSFGGGLFQILWPVARNLGQAYVLQLVENLLANQHPPDPKGARTNAPSAHRFGESLNSRE